MMTKKELRQWLINNAFTHDGTNINVHWANKYPVIFQELIDQTPFFTDSVSLTLRTMTFLNGQIGLNKCVICGNDITDFGRKNPQVYCGIQCRNKGGSIKTKKTCLDKYGVNNPMKVKDVRAKVVETNRVRYGGVAPACSKRVREKMTLTCEQRFGVHNAMLDGEISARSAYSRSKNYKSLLDEEIYKLLKNKDELTRLYEEGLSSWMIADRLGVSPGTVIYYLNKYNLSFREHGYSAEEQSWHLFLESIYDGEIIYNTHKLINPFEIDIYLPEANLAIEYDGLYWHSELQGKDKNYHLNKTLLCKEKGVQLLHIFSSDNQELWKSVILAKLGLTSRIYARKCKVINVPSKLARLFLDSNHLQGFIPSSIYVGLEYNDELVSIMTFGKPRFNSSYDYELFRFCNKSGYSVIGGASRLLKHSVVKSCITYANLRWSDGNLYDALGFEYLGDTKPNYFYTNDYLKLHNRIQFQKHRLPNKLVNYDDSLSVDQNMFNHGYDRIYDCGQLKYGIKI